MLSPLSLKTSSAILALHDLDPGWSERNEEAESKVVDTVVMLLSKELPCGSAKTMKPEKSRRRLPLRTLSKRTHHPLLHLRLLFLFVPT
ncbi:unnamed protein product [Sphenostylis stenocarpa]|uniref:Uncharacterized protein n=1 Tax=Sphenostylis stenocarpa TaxID=92480 RepID=A0AA86T261_9FABA|nr:unnamed protein product [Sphenostylis stenocarpa]